MTAREYQRRDEFVRVSETIKQVARPLKECCLLGG